jgi:hypothetical protein
LVRFTLPPTDSTMNVYAEGNSQEDADRLIDDVSRHITQLVEA